MHARNRTQEHTCNQWYNFKYISWIDSKFIHSEVKGKKKYRLGTESKTAETKYKEVSIS